MNFTCDTNAFLLSGGLQACHQRAQLCARCPQMFLCLLALRDVLCNACQTIDTSSLIFYGEPTIPYPPYRVVWPDHAILHSNPPLSFPGKHLNDTRAVLRMNRVDKGAGVLIQTLTCASPDCLVGGADVEDLAQVGGRHPEDLVDIFCQLPEPFFTLAHRCLGL